MRFVRAQANGETFYGAIEADQVKVLTRPPYEDISYGGKAYPLSAVKLLAPCEPSKVVCIGQNYDDHKYEIAEIPPSVEPVLFIKPNTAINDPEGDIDYPEICHSLHYEAELGIIIGKKAHKVKAADAYDYIFGYTCLNDVSARDIQAHDGQWTRGKGFDTFCPIGPWIETELDAQNVAVCSRLNGEVRQSSNTSFMIKNIAQLIEIMSECMTLLPGDIIATGTPKGVGAMEHGDVIEIEVQGIGILKNRVK
jgi:2-keto-4-pentenoate hydratase/2-oxohepta-3-ene-1,7-dioic acid hydratase in catechol pathway